MPKPRQDRQPLPKCGKIKKNGKPCELPAGWGTTHPGKGRCRKHKGNRGPLKTYQHSMTEPPAFLQELIDKYYRDPRLMDLQYQQAKMFAFMEIIESRLKSPKRLTLEILKELRDNIKVCSRNIERNARIELNNQYKVHIENLDVLGDISAQTLTEIVEEYVPKKNQQTAKEKALRKLEFRIKERVHAIRSAE